MPAISSFSGAGAADVEAKARKGKRGPPVAPLAVEAVKRIDALFYRRPDEMTCGHFMARR